jgi:hypothetical protein
MLLAAPSMSMFEVLNRTGPQILGPPDFCSPVIICKAFWSTSSDPCGLACRPASLCYMNEYDLVPNRFSFPQAFASRVRVHLVVILARRCSKF